MLDGKKDIVRLYSNYSKIVDKNWYLSEYEDVKASGENPVVHFIAHGELEDRNPNGFINTSYVRSQINLGSDEIRPIELLLASPLSECPRPLPCIDLSFVCKSYGLGNALDAIEYLNSVSGPITTAKWFDQSLISEFNGKSTKNPYHDFLNLLAVRFQFSNEYAAIEKSMYVARYQNDFDAVDTFRWNMNTWVIARTRISSKVMDQIAQQYRLEPMTAYSNPKYIPFLRNFSATDLARRDLIDTKKLFDGLDKNVHTVILIDKLQIGGAEKFVLNLAREISSISGVDVEVLVTDQTQNDLEHYVSVNDIELQEVSVKSMLDCFAKTWKKDFILAQYLMMKQCKNIVICNSFEGYKVLSNYGKQLSSKSALFSVFFSEAPVEYGVSHSVRHLIDAVQFGYVVSDNQNYIDQVKVRIPKVPEEKFQLLPSLLKSNNLCLFESSLVKARINQSKQKKILWYGRVEVLKDIESLIEFGRINRNVSIDVFGPIDLYEQYDFPPNLFLKGAVRHLNEIELIDYDLFLFTSKFEGMPNTVLEVADAGIPIIAADVGDIRTTFGSDSIFIFENSKISKVTAANISTSFEEYLSLGESELERRVVNAKQKVIDHHSPVVYRNKVKSIFFLGEEFAQ